MRLTLAAFAAVLCVPVLAQNSQLDLEDRAGKAFETNDCKSALDLYRVALESARAQQEWAKVALFERRTGICYNRSGKVEDGWTAYAAGVAAAEKAHDPELLRENLHGSAVALRHLGRHTEALTAAQRALTLAQACGHPDHLVPELAELATFENQPHTSFSSGPSNRCRIALSANSLPFLVINKSHLSA